MNSDETDNQADKTTDIPVSPPIIPEGENISPDGTSESGKPESEESPDREAKKSKEPTGGKAKKNTELFASDKKKNSSLHGAVQIVLGLAAGAGAGYLFYRVAPASFMPFDFIFFLIFIITALFIILNVYNIGRLIAGRLCGGQFISFQFTCLRFYKAGGAVRRRFVLSRFFGGECSQLPPADKTYHVNHYLAFYAGGVAACIAVGCICAAAAALLQRTVPGHLFNAGNPAHLPVFLWINTGLSFLFALFCLLPFFWGDTPSDGVILFSLLKKNPAAPQLILLHALTTQLSAGIRPSDMKIPVISPVMIVKRRHGSISVPIKKAAAYLLKITERIKVFFTVIYSFVFIREGRGKKACAGNKAVTDDTTALSAAEISEMTGREEIKAPKEETAGSAAADESAFAPDASDEPSPEAPVSDGPASDEPASDEPASEAPASEAPVFDEHAAGSDAEEKADNADEDRTFDITDRPIKKQKRIKHALNAGILIYKIKLLFFPRKINRKEIEIVLFPKPDENSRLSLCALLLELYAYYFALDNADYQGMRTHLMVMKDHITRLPAQIRQRVCRELCFYYSIDKNAASAAYYLEMAENGPEQKKKPDSMRVRAYYEMYINRRYRTAFTVCRTALETISPDTPNGLTVMNAELIKALVSLLHQKNLLNKSE